MKWLARFFFYTYVGLVVLAGAWGVFGDVQLDFHILFDQDLNELTPYSRTNLLSQYRFLRGLEMGFGIFAIYYNKQIFTQAEFSKIFLAVMGFGILGRAISWAIDGQPGYLAIFFLVYEFIGWLVILIYTLKLHHNHADKKN